MRFTCFSIFDFLPLTARKAMISIWVAGAVFGGHVVPFDKFCELRKYWFKVHFLEGVGTSTDSSREIPGEYL